MASIAVGAFGSVYRVYEPKLGLWLAQKSISKSTARKHAENILSEIKVQLWVRHENLISLYHFYADEFSIHLLMELVIGDNLAVRICSHKPTVCQMKSIIRQVLSGLAYLHANHIVHRDIKPENILVLDSSYQMIKVCDFGFAYHRHWEGNECLGTLEYMAPEMVSGDSYNEKVDVWSLGAIFYELVTNTPIVPSNTNKYLFLNNVRNRPCSFRKIVLTIRRCTTTKSGESSKSAYREIRTKGVVRATYSWSRGFISDWNEALVFHRV